MNINQKQAKICAQYSIGLQQSISQIKTYSLILISFIFLSFSGCNQVDDSSKTQEQKASSNVGSSDHKNTLSEIESTDHKEDPTEIESIDLNVLQNLYKDLKSGPTIHHNPQKVKSIVVLLIDTLRHDYLTPANAPFITSYLNRHEVSNFETSRSTATSTAHSLFGFYWGMLPHIRYQLIEDNYVNKFNPSFSKNRAYMQGSPFLLLLKGLGYQVETFGYQDIDFCFGPTTHKPLQDGQLIFLQLNYSLNGHSFLNYCEPYKKVQTGPNRYNAGRLDDDVIDRFISRNRHAAHQPTISIIRLQGVHHPYGWISKKRMDSEYLDAYPFDWNVPAKLFWEAGEKSLTDRTNIQNSYKNAVRSTDYQFWKLIKALENSGAYDDSIVLLASDHGHALMDLNTTDPALARTNGHGQIPYTPLSNNIFAVKWPKALIPSTAHSINQKMVSLSDFFPTVLDYLEVDYKKLLSGLPIYGESLFSKTSNCEITFKPEYDFPAKGQPPKKLSFFTIDNGKEKFFMEMTLTKQGNYQNQIKLLNHTDESDTQISDSTSGILDLDHYVNSNFSSCLSKIFLKDVEVRTNSERSVSSILLTGDQNSSSAGFLRRVKSKFSTLLGRIWKSQ